MKKSWHQNTSGQMMMIGVLLFFILLAVIPAVIFMNRSHSHFSIFSQKKSKGRLIAEEGAALALQQLSKPGRWPYFAGGTLPTPNPTTVSSTQGGSYVLTYIPAPAPGVQSYQVGIRSAPLDAAGQPIPGSSILTTVSQRTIGVKLPTGLSASVALDLMKVPVVSIPTALLRVEFGPIVVRDANTWTLNPYLDISRRPRKFAAGGIAPRATNPDSQITSDQKEYWAYASPGFAPVVDSNFYIDRARNSQCPPTVCLGVGNCAPEAGNNCYFPNVGADTIVFNGNWPTNPGGTIYVAGNAHINSATFDVSNGGGLIVTGNLTLANNSRPLSGYSPVTTLYLPPGLGSEDPNCSCSDPWCIGVVDRHIDFRGFLYVKGNVTTLPPPPDNNWTLLGTARVDGTLTLVPNTSFVLFYNDLTNHAIRTTNFELQIDSMTAVP